MDGDVTGRKIEIIPKTKQKKTIEKQEMDRKTNCGGRLPDRLLVLGDLALLLIRAFLLQHCNIAESRE